AIVPTPGLRRTATGSVLILIAVAAGCGGSSHSGSTTESVPAYVTAPFTHEQRLVEQGATLVVADGCSVCHLAPKRSALGPSFSSLAGHRVTLRDGQRVLVDERFLERALSHPGELSIRGYPQEPMIEAIERAHLPQHPDQVRALAAFIEQIGPEA
ncbi:MAG TPA: hypothetical protein VMB05_07310, partial [Solirubrobacteraceae bacterium]|nr:hypothetical protein [Solirubrobacteraceae bacterium]